MKKILKVDLTNQSIDVFIQDSSATDGSGLTGLVFNSAGLTCYYRRGATGTATALTLATQTVGGAHSDGGFVEVDATNMPGVYRLDLSDAIVATGVTTVILYLQGATNMAPCTVEIQLDSIPADIVEINGDAAAAAMLEAFMDSSILAQVNGGVPTTTAFIADGFTEATNDHFNGRLITFKSGALLGQQTAITDYVGSTQTFTVEALTEAPADDDFFVIH